VLYKVHNHKLQFSISVKCSK